MWRKYIQIIKNTLSEYSLYRLNFLMWRVRSFISFLSIYLFWWAVFLPSGNISKQYFNWQQEEILTYILAVAILRSIIFSSRTIDVGTEINQGNLTNYLLKPLNFFSYWFCRDLADKTLNIICSLFELGLFFLILKPVLIWQTDPFLILMTTIAVVIAVVLYFYINLFFGLIAFWTPESWSGVWGPRFVFTIILEFFGGTLFPLDILPKTVSNLLQLTPFPYFLYYPIKIFLGQASYWEILSGLIISLGWLGISYLVINKMWRAGLRVYGAEGR